MSTIHKCNNMLHEKDAIILPRSQQPEAIGASHWVYLVSDNRGRYYRGFSYCPYCGKELIIKEES